MSQLIVSLSGGGSGIVTSVVGGDNINVQTVAGVATVNLNTSIQWPITSVDLTQGAILLDGDRFLYTYGNSTFLGINSGNTTNAGDFSTAVGRSCLISQTNALDNCAYGYGAAISVQTGSYNSIIGTVAGGGLVDGSENVLIGRGANAGISGNNNTIIGTTASGGLINGNNNCLYGRQVAPLLASGSDNCIFGQGAGNAYTTSESSNILISNGGVIGENNTTRIGTDGSGAGQQNQCFVAGIFGATVGVSGIPVVVDNTGQLGTVVSSIRYKENVADIGASDVLKLRPVKFNYINKPDITAVGLIAEEVETIMPHLVVYNKQGLPESVKYHELPILLLSEIKKLVKRIEMLEGEDR